MLYITALSFFVFGIISGYILGNIFEKHEEHISLTRKSLERLLIERNDLINECLERKNKVNEDL